MAKHQSVRTRQLLEAIVANFDKRKKAAEALMAELGIDVELTYATKPPMRAQSIETFSKYKQIPLSPMLAQRFDFASDIVRGLDVWAGTDQIATLTNAKHVKLLHKSLRRHWVNSAPAKYDDASLSLFGYTVDVPENIVYLAWTGEIEPQVYVYVGQKEESYENLDEYLHWCLTRP